jgi:hypothetical protein
MIYTVWGVYGKDSDEVDSMFESWIEADFYKRQIEQPGVEYELKQLEIEVDI